MPKPKPKKPSRTPLLDPQAKERKSPVGVTLSPDDLYMVGVIQARYKMNRSAAIRACIHRVYSMTED